MSDELSDAEIRRVIESIITDYRNKEKKFSEYNLPEYDVLDSFSEEEIANFITFATSINLNRETTGEGGVWQKCKRLYDSENYNWVFDPKRVADMNGIDLYESVFSQIGLGGSASGIWCGVGQSLQDDVNGDIMSLLERTNRNAVHLKNHVVENEYPSLRREKVGHLWLRLIDEEVNELEDIEKIAIPVDRHIITVTEKLQQEEYSRDSDEDLEEIRIFWDEICELEEYYPVEIDKPLWLIGKYWEDWGEDYLQKKIDVVC